jgi:hypothetical protein
MTANENTTNLETARLVAAANGLHVPDDRLELFASSLARNTEMMKTLLAIDLGEHEPASRFRAPPSK